jgi:hypothetical protein
MQVLLFLLLLIPIQSFGGNWIAKPDIAQANSQAPGVRGYQNEAACKAANPGQTCHDYSGQNLRYRRVNVGGTWEDNPAAKTAYDAEQTQKANRRTARIARRLRLRQAAIDIDSVLTVVEIRPMVKDLLVELNQSMGNN